MRVERGPGTVSWEGLWRQGKRVGAAVDRGSSLGAGIL